MYKVSELVEHLKYITERRKEILADNSLSTEQKKEMLAILDNANDELNQSVDIYERLLNLTDIETKQTLLEDLEKSLNDAQIALDDFNSKYDDAINSVSTKISEFKQQIWDDVNVALGQFSRTFYIDAENGDDTNTGLTESSAFKTLRKAYDSALVGGEIYIRLLSDIVQDFNYTLVGKNVVLDTNGRHQIKHIAYTYGELALIYRTTLSNSSLTYIVRDIDETAEYKEYIVIENDTGYPISIYSSAIQHSYYRQSNFFNIVFLNKNPDAVLLKLENDTRLYSQTASSSFSQASIFNFGGYYLGKIILHNNSELCRVVGTLFGNIDVRNFLIVDENDNTISIQDKIAGNVIDADSGVSKNLFFYIEE